MKKLIAIGFIVGLLIVVTVFSWHHFNYSSDAVIRHQLPGNWVSDTQAAKGTIIFNSDGSFVADGTFIISTNERQVAYEGTWQIKDSFLIETTTKSATEGARVGAVARNKIIRVNDQELVYLTEHGNTVTRKRSQ
jgi:hypothetical protein